jgi:hypothetical protein
MYSFHLLLRPKDRHTTATGVANAFRQNDKQLRRTTDSTGALFASQDSLEEYGGTEAVRQSMNRPSSRSGNNREPKMIYSQSFSNGLPQEHQHKQRRHNHQHRRSAGGSGHFVPLDDRLRLAPMASFDESNGNCRHSRHRMSDSQSDIGTPMTETVSLLDGHGEPYRRPYSVQSHRGRDDRGSFR